VEDERWISAARFNRLLAVLQVLPGPEAHELCVHLGMIARGRAGGVLAGLGFLLPGLVLMLATGWLYVRLIAGNLAWGGALLGVQMVVLAIIARAVVRIGQHVIEDRWLAAVAMGAFLATLTGVPFWIPLAAAGLAYALAHRLLLVGAVLAFAVTAAVALRPAGEPGLAAAAAVSAALPVTLAGLFVAGLKGGLLTFGGAYTAIPYVRTDTVGRGWIADATFLDGIALAGVLPAPLVIFATFVGYVAGGLAGALAITAGMFLPAFGFSLLFFERLEAVIENEALHRLLAGVAAAVVGIIGATFVQLVVATGSHVPQPIIGVALFALALATAWRLKRPWGTPAIVAGGAAAGWLALG
jgi:chromate transporter